MSILKVNRESDVKIIAFNSVMYGTLKHMGLSVLRCAQIYQPRSSESFPGNQEAVCRLEFLARSLRWDGLFHACMKSETE